jgi:hypothetical protein
MFGDAGLADIDAELEKLTVVSRRSPQRVDDAHLADQPANFQRHRWSTAAGCRPECGWNLRGAISDILKLSDQAARSIG